MLTDADLAAIKEAGGDFFAFQPPVRGFAENRWRFDQSTRIEFCATNLGSGDQVWFPRSSITRVMMEPQAVTLVLNREYEYKGGLWPVKSASSPGSTAPPGA